MMYWSGTPHFSHITQNVLENSRVRELRLKPKVCDSTFTIILPLSHTLFSQNHLTSGDLKFLGKNMLFYECFEAPLTRAKSVFWIRADTFANLLIFLLSGHSLFFSVCSSFCCRKCLCISKAFQTLCVSFVSSFEVKMYP